MKSCCMKLGKNVWQEFSLSQNNRMLLFKLLQDSFGYDMLFEQMY